MPPSSTSSDRYSPPYRNSCECTGPASHSGKSPVSQTTNPDTRRDRSPSCTPNIPRAAAPSHPPAPPPDTSPRPSLQICTTPHLQTPQKPTPRHAQSSASSSARVSRGTPPSSPVPRPPCPCALPP